MAPRSGCTGKGQDAEAARRGSGSCACAVPPKRGGGGGELSGPWRPGAASRLRSWAPHTAPRKPPRGRSRVSLRRTQSQLEAGQWLGGSGLAGQDLPVPRIPEWGHCRGSLPQEEARSQAPCQMLAAVWRPGEQRPPQAQTRPELGPGGCRKRGGARLAQESGELPGGVLSCPCSAMPPQDDPPPPRPAPTPAPEGEPTTRGPGVPLYEPLP
ncbi:splicing factor, proline- and glutamine-rich-like [Cervus elaphus]|uniref:splicing factor, proline- and glutamine-rich-like n=1 Tax=Cervus elaphus TaxID=9860 RepID=UPI001CC271B1|nr:splicing factor, proline- and glutamine-rich-like [Cervus elaphus]